MEDVQLHKREFSRLFRLFTPWATAEILGEVIGDVDFRKSSKQEMAEAYAYGRHGLDKCSLQDLGKAVTKFVNLHVRMIAGEEPHEDEHAQS